MPFRASFRIARGLRLSISRGGARATVSAPGTGLSYITATLPTGRKRSRRSPHITFGSWLFGAAITLALLWWFGWL
jgi:hypothetical protein